MQTESTENRLMEMLTGYAAAHQHPANVAVHMLGIPTIMLGALIPLSWAAVEMGGFRLTLAQLVVFGFFLFYLTLDRIFALVFLVFGMAIAMLAELLGGFGIKASGTLAAALFVGGYLAQFIGHFIEKSAPVLLRHPIQANLAAPFFTIVELFGMLGLRRRLFEQVAAAVEQRRREEAGTV